MTICELTGAGGCVEEQVGPALIGGQQRADHEALLVSLGGVFQHPRESPAVAVRLAAQGGVGEQTPRPPVGRRAARPGEAGVTWSQPRCWWGGTSIA